MPLSDRQKDNLEDAAASTLEGLVAMIPIFGGPGAVVVNRAFGSAVARRQEKLLAELRMDLDALVESGRIPDPVEAMATDRFIADFFRLFRSMEETADDEKLQLLRNALLNGLDPKLAVPEREGTLFTRIISRYDPEHLRVLDAALKGAPNRHGSGSATDRRGIEIQLNGMPQYWSHDSDAQEARTDTNNIVSELVSDGLLNEDTSTKVNQRFGRSLDGAVPDQEIQTKTTIRVSDRGLRFLRLVSDT